MNFDDDYVDPSESRGQSRPGYAKMRRLVAQRQKMRRTASGNMEFESAITPGRWIELDSKGRETILRDSKKIKKRKKDPLIRRQPALDHIVQYAALNEHYHSVVKAEREKANNGLKRRNSLDLHTAFSNSVADPGNLRLVSHQEHKSFGGSKRTGQFSNTEKRQAKSLFEKHIPPIESTSKEFASFNFSRPKSSVPLSSGTVFTRRVSPRQKQKSKF